MWTIAKLSVQEMIRKKVFLVTMILTGIFLFVYGLGLHIAFKDGGDNLIVKTVIFTQLLSAGLYMASFIVAFLVLFTAVGSISTELENGTLQTIVVKPIKRWEIIVGKYLGMGMVIAVYSIFFFLVIIALNRQISLPALNLIRSLGIFCLQGLVFLSLVLLGSTVFTTLNNGIIMVILYGIGMIGGIVEQVGNLIGKEALINLGIVTSLVVPFDSLYRKMLYTLFSASDLGQLNLFTQQGPFGVGSQPSVWMMVYVLIYGSLALYGAARIFTRKDI
ncbi:MAG TPA: ABC transporter permease [Clostridia bacterium]|nr:ABC transporter permease [Clostridia bacterium]